MIAHTDPWTTAFEAIDRAFAGSPRPEKFTDHPYCDEYADAHQYFSGFTPVTLAYVTEPPETLPNAFLTDEAFHFLLPGMLRWLPRTGNQYCVGDVLFHVENRLLYLVYDRLEPEIRASAFDYPTIWRILDQLEEHGSADSG